MLYGCLMVEPVSRDGDFRAALYDRYVSTFKGGARVHAEPSFAWWDHKYLPLLNDLDRAAPILEIGCGDGGLLAYLAEQAKGLGLSDPARYAGLRGTLDGNVTAAYEPLIAMMPRTAKRAFFT